MMRKLYVIALSLFASVSFAQSVKFDVYKNQSYEPLTDATVLSPNYAWGFIEELVPDFGFSINSFNESVLKYFGVSEFEVVLLSDDFEIEQTLTPLVNSEEFWILDRGFDESKSVEENEGNPSLSTISYKLEKVGFTGEDVLKVEWKNVKLNGSTAADSVNFQVWCYIDGSIEYHYGPSYLAESVFYDEFEISFFEKDEVEFFYYYALSGTPNDPSLVKDALSFHYVDALPENGTVYRFYRGAMGIGEKGKNTSNLLVFPNPTKDIIKLNVPIKIEQVSIVDVNGKEVYSATLNHSNTIDISPFPKGIYFLELEVEGEIWRKKIAKE